VNVILGVIRTCCFILTLVFVRFLIKWRAAHSGKVCAGAFLSEDQRNNELLVLNYEIGRGGFLKLIMLYYIFIAVGFGLVMPFLCLRKKWDEEQLEKQERFNQHAADLFRDKSVEFRRPRLSV